MDPAEPNHSLSSELSAAAESAHAQGKLIEAERLARQAVAAEATALSPQLTLGVVLAKQFKLEEAWLVLEAVAAADPGDFQSRLWLSRLARKSGQLSASATYANQAHELRPDSTEAILNLGLTLVDTKQYPEAVLLLQRAAELMPQAAGVFLYLGMAYQNLGQLDLARAGFSRALELDSKSAEAYLGLGQVLLAGADVANAGNLASRAISLNPRNVAAHHLLVEALLESNRTAEAEAHARRLVSEFPDDATARTLLGRCLLTLGKTDDAIRSLESTVEIFPTQGTAYCLLAQSHKFGPEDAAFLSKLQSTALLPTPNLREASYLHFALGKIYEDLGQYRQAMAAFDEANRLAYLVKFGIGELDREAYSEYVKATIEAMDVLFLDRYREIGNASAQPIFIVGMIRSGTTLVENVLASHPKIGAAGENRFWQAHWMRTFSGPEGELSPEILAQLSEGYLALLNQAGAGKVRVTDKLPGNYARLGLLHVAFPNARIVHIRRNPVDTCISIYITPNSALNEFGHDRSNIVFGYREYQNFMDHWRSVLPTDRFYELDYEELIDDQERVSRQLIDFLGLEWDDAVLHPETVSRPISTPSATQARRPVYRSSIGRYEHYRDLLGPFAELLNQ